MLRSIVATIVLLGAAALGSAAQKQPNVVFIITDDQSAVHVGAYGDKALRTPNLDKLAAEGVRFENAFTACPSCTPSRSSILTGQQIYRLGEAGVLYGRLSPDQPIWTIALQQAGYHMGSTGKIWGPGYLPKDEFPVDPFGKRYYQHKERTARGLSNIDYAANFEQFLKERPEDKPFCFWLGTIEPHQPYAIGRGEELGMDPEKAQLFSCWPDHPDVRGEMLDYYAEIEHIDQHVGRVVAALEQAGQLENTVIIFTSDHGNPLPRAKCNLYDAGTRVPLIVRYPPAVPAGRVVTDYVLLPDIAPTMLEIAGLDAPEVMTSRSMWSTATSKKSGRIDADRNEVVMAFERHTLCRPGDVGYPMRALRTENYLYIRNYEPDRWPAGDPDLKAAAQGVAGDIDRGATKQVLLDHRDDPAVRHYYELAIGQRPTEELYDLKRDPEQLNNVASDPGYASIRMELAGRLNDYLARTGDPRQNGQAPWDDYPYYSRDVIRAIEKAK